MPITSFEDFYEVPNLNFDISKLREDLEKILKNKKFNSPGVTHFGAIPINQIPNDESSIRGNNIRGRYWTIADDTGKEVSRDIDIDESKYTQLVPEFENTYFKKVYKTLSYRFKLGRVRLLLKEPRSTLSWHKDPECRLHVPIITNKGFKSPNGVTNFGAIPLNKIPNDENSTKGNNIRGIYWTIPDENGKSYF